MLHGGHAPTMQLPPQGGAARTVYEEPHFLWLPLVTQLQQQVWCLLFPVHHTPCGAAALYNISTNVPTIGF